MSEAFRPSWAPRVDAAGEPVANHPYLLVSLLLAFGLLAGVSGGIIGAAINDDRAVRGILPGLLWAAPYVLSAIGCWSGAMRSWYALAQALGVWGTLVAAGALYWIPKVGNVGGGPMPPMGALLWILLALLAGNVAIVIRVRREAERRLGEGLRLPSLIYSPVPLWFLLAIAVS